MTTLPLPSPANRAPLWLTVTSIAGIGWNLFGVVQFAGSFTATAGSLIASGITPEQAAVMTGYPAWMTVAFGLGVTGGLVGSVLLLLRNRLAYHVLAVSLVAYVALWIGDAAHGVFAALGTPQVVTLTLVVAIAAALFVAARHPVARA
jgi:hypothetical protein